MTHKLDRFQPPTPSDEPSANCVNCGAERPAGELYYDERADHYVCGRDCFDEWHDANQAEVGDYYFEMNLE